VGRPAAAERKDAVRARSAKVESRSDAVDDEQEEDELDEVRLDDLDVDDADEDTALDLQFSPPPAKSTARGFR